MRKDANGFRFDQYYGFWAIEPVRFTNLVEMAKAADLEALRREARASNSDTAERPPYTRTESGIAVINISGRQPGRPAGRHSRLARRQGDGARS